MKNYMKESDETKRKILHAAKTEFADKGFSGARMSSIARTAGVNQALLHYHFAGKENIYIEVLKKLVNDISKVYGENIIDEINSWKAEPDLRLCAAIYVFVNSALYIRDDEFHRIVAYEIAEGKGILHGFVKEYLLPHLLSVEEIINDGIEARIFEISNATLFSINIISFIKDVTHAEEFFKDTGLYTRIYKNGYEDLYGFMTELAFKGLRPTGKALKIPVLDENKKNKINSILEEMRDNIRNF